MTKHRLTPAPQRTSAGAISRRQFSAATLAASAAYAFGMLAVGNTPAQAAQPATAKSWNQLPVSPRVHADGRITFLLPVGSSKTAVLNLGSQKPMPMTLNADGYWHVTTGPLAPEIYSYTFEVDGLRILDPLNPWVKKNLFYPSSLVLVPASPPAPWQTTHVPHGTVTEHFYHSPIAADDRNLFVYTPPNYNPRAALRYPVLYLLHGYSDVASAWTATGRANIMLDNLIAAKKATPMIVVMPLGYGDDGVVSRTGPGLGDKQLFSRNMQNFQAQMFTEIMPLVAKHYQIKTGPAHTAIAGLSMGGGEALAVGLNNLHSFGWVCGLSSYCGTNGPDFSRVFPHLTSKDNARIKLLWIACGRHDPIVLKENRNLDAWLTARDIQFKSIWTPGGHQWRVWRDNFIHLAPLLFKM